MGAKDSTVKLFGLEINRIIMEAARIVENFGRTSTNIK